MTSNFGTNYRRPIPPDNMTEHQQLWWNKFCHEWNRGLISYEELHADMDEVMQGKYHDITPSS